MAKRKGKKAVFDPADLPSILYVYQEAEDGGDGGYQMAQISVDGIDLGTVVGVYELQSVGRVNVRTTLEDI